MVCDAVNQAAEDERAQRGGGKDGESFQRFAWPPSYLIAEKGQSTPPGTSSVSEKQRVRENRARTVITGSIVRPGSGSGVPRMQPLPMYLLRRAGCRQKAEGGTAGRLRHPCRMRSRLGAGVE